MCLKPQFQNSHPSLIEVRFLTSKFFCLISFKRVNEIKKSPKLLNQSQTLFFVNLNHVNPVSYPVGFTK